MSILTPVECQQSDAVFIYIQKMCSVKTIDSSVHESSFLANQENCYLSKGPGLGHGIHICCCALAKEKTGHQAKASRQKSVFRAMVKTPSVDIHDDQYSTRLHCESV